MVYDGTAMWLLTSYFNPGRFARRQVNYRTFRKHLPTDLPLVTVECSADGAFELGKDDADILIQVRGDVMWQKERLLSIAIEAVPESVRAVAWLDCDVVFEEESWPERTLDALARASVAQLFDRVCWLESDEEFGKPAAERSGMFWPSLTREHLDGVLAEEMCVVWRRTDGSNLPIGDGYAWAADRALVARHGLYDACIIGGGTRPFALVSMGYVDALLAAAWLTEAQRAHLAEWARPIAADVGGRVACVPGRIFHLWHGAISNRRYSVRDQEFKRFGFDPYVDIKRNADGCWEWADHRTEMRDWLRSYFRGRKEDEHSRPTGRSA
jgi:hypothetical protein